MSTTRDAYDYNGVKVGTLSLPNETTEEEWALALSAYSSLPPVVITDVTPRQIRQALVLSGVSIPTIEAALASLPEPHKSLAQIEWEYSTLFIRKNPLVAQVGVLLGWTSNQLDDLWLFAGKL